MFESIKFGGGGGVDWWPIHNVASVPDLTLLKIPVYVQDVFYVAAHSTTAYFM